MMIKVLLVDDHPLMRKGMEQLLRLSPLFSEIIESDNGTEALSLAARYHPDLIILDLNMKGLSGLDTLIALKAQNHQALVAILTVSDSQEDYEKLMIAGADAYYLKDLCPQVLLDSLLNLFVKNKSYSALQMSSPENQGISANPSQLNLLTKRERQVLHFVAKGWRNKQIADQIYISEATVKVHIKNILKKLNINSRVTASLIYLEHQKNDN